MKDLEDEADRLLEKLQPIRKLQDNLRRNISQIKELINQARKQANSVSCYSHTWFCSVFNLELENAFLIEFNGSVPASAADVFSLQIKVSVSSGGDCLRSYRPDIRKGRYNTITLHVKTATPDNLLLYLGSAKFVSRPLRPFSFATAGSSI